MRSTCLGLDVSPRRIGWALCDLVTGEPMACGCEVLWPDDKVPVEWTKQRKLIFDALATPHWFNGGEVTEIQAIFIEDTAGAGKFRQHDAGRAQGIVQAEVERRWPWVTVQFLKPSEWKKLAGLKGNASKEEIAFHVGTILPPPGFDVTSQDAADALLIAVAGQRRNRETWDRGNEEAA